MADADFGVPGALFGGGGLFGSPPLPPENLLGSLGDNPLFAMGLGPLAEKFGAPYGLVPGAFGGGRSLYSQMEAIRLGRARRQAMAMGAEADRETYRSVFEGIARMTGTPYGVAERRAADVLSGDVAMMAPILAQMMPETFDAMHGSRGSATVLASHLSAGGRYMADPVTGRSGMSAASTGELSRRMFSEFFGPGADLAAWRGLSAGGAGSLFDQLVTQGAMPASIGALGERPRMQAILNDPNARREAIEQLRAIDPARVGAAADRAGLRGVPADQLAGRLSEIRAAADPLVEGLIKTGESSSVDPILRSVDSRRIADRLKSLSGAVSAIRDLFGDAGHADAPMAELIAGLNSLTQGGLSNLDPGRLEQTIRMTSQISRRSGMSLRGMTGLMAQGAAMADEFGLDRSMVPELSHLAAAYGAAYGRSGLGAIAAPGAADRERLTLMSQRSAAAAAASEMANAQGAIGSAYEAARAAGAVPAELAAAYESIRSGNSAGLPADATSAQAFLSRVLGDSQAAGQFVRNTTANREVAGRLGVVGNVVRAQSGEIQETISRQLSQGFRGLGDTLGLDASRSGAFSAALAQAGVRGFFEMGVEAYSNPAARQAETQRRLLEAAVAFDPELGARIAGSTDLLQRLSVGGAAFQGSFSQLAGGRQFGYGSDQNLLRIHDRGVQEQAARDLKDDRARAAVEAALAPLTSAGPMRRIADLVQDRGTKSVGEMVARALGGEDPEKAAMLLRELEAAAADPSRSMVDLKGGGLAVDRGALNFVLGEQAANLQALRSGPAAPSDPKELALFNLRQEYAAALSTGAGARDLAGRLGNEAPQLGLKTEELTRMQRALTIRAGGDPAAGRAHAAAVVKEKLGLDLTDALAAKLVDPADPRLSRGEKTVLRALYFNSATTGDFSEAADQPLNQPVDPADLKAAAEAGGVLASARAAGKDSAVAARGYADRAALASVVYGDVRAVAALGAGGGKLARDAYDARRELELLANKQGVSVGELLNQKSPEADALLKRLNADFLEMHRRMQPGARVAPMSDAERRAMEAEIAAETAGDPEVRGRNLLRSILGTADGTDVSGLASELGKGANGDLAQFALRRMQQGRAALDTRARELGVGSIAELRQLDTSAETARNFQLAGPLGAVNRVDAAALKQAVSESNRQATQAAAPQGPLTVKIDGKSQITIDGETRTATLSLQGIGDFFDRSGAGLAPRPARA